MNYAICLGLFLGTTQVAGADQPISKPAVVPFELLKSRHMVVHIKVNGKGPYRVIFDTGAPVMLLNTRVGKEAGLLSAKGGALALSLFGNIGQAKIKTLEIGAAKAVNIPVIIMDHPTVELISKVLGPVEGIVGFPFFARFKMTIDYQAKELTFQPSGFEPPDTLQALINTVMALADAKPAKTRVLVPAALWGMVVDKEESDEKPGADVKQVMTGSPAAAAGLKAGDRVLTLDDRWTDTVADIYEAVAHVKARTSVHLKVLRQGKDFDLKVVPQDGF